MKKVLYQSKVSTNDDNFSGFLRFFENIFHEIHERKFKSNGNDGKEIIKTQEIF